MQKLLLNVDAMFIRSEVSHMHVQVIFALYRHHSHMPQYPCLSQSLSKIWSPLYAGQGLNDLLFGFTASFCQAPVFCKEAREDCCNASIEIGCTCWFGI